MTSSDQQTDSGTSLFQAVTSQLPLPMLVHVAGTIRYINQNCVQLLGGDHADEFVGHSIGNVIHPDYRPAAFDRVARILAGEPEVESVELKLLRRDGQEVWIETTGIRIVYEGQQAIYVIGKDISDRKRMEVQEKKRLQDMQYLYLLSNAVANGDPIDRLSAVALDATENVLGTAYAAIVLFDAEGPKRCVASRQVSTRFEQALLAHLPGNYYSTGPEALYISDMAIGGHSPALMAAAAAEGIHAMACVPLIHQGHWIGQYLVFYPSSHVFSTAEQQLSRTIAFHLALGVERKINEAEIHSLAYFDPLTRLANRRRLYDNIRLAMAESARRDRHGAVIVIDLDYFKTINDTRGHEVGDQLLCLVARRLQNSLDGDDSVARMGGDEFVVLLQDLAQDASEAAAQAELYSQQLRAKLSRPYVLKGQEYHSTPSMGIALFRDAGQSIDDLIKQADIAMYQAKAAGRNAVRLFDEAIQVSLEQRLDLENDLHKAISEDQFQLYYQIQVDSAHAVVGVEALLRWMHPQRGMVAPGTFIPLAEETGLIVPIGEWVLRKACRQIRDWAADPAWSAMRMSVNVSSVQFRHEGFVPMVERLLQETGIDPGRLKFELTESVMLQDVDSVIGKMLQIRQMGIGFSIDDFGTGFSSLNYLKQLPLQQLKIDQSFVRDLVSDANDQAIVQAIATMGQAFGLNIIAEGVETEAQRQQLLQSGCTHYQGYLFARPMPLGSLEALLAQWPVQARVHAQA